MVLFKAYIGLGNLEDSTRYLDLFTKINDSINSAEKKAVEKPIKQIISEKEKMINMKLNQFITAITVVFLLMITLGVVIWVRKEKRLHKKYELIIKKLEEAKEQIKTKNNENKFFEKTPQKTIQIADETVVAILSKLEKFEKSNKFMLCFIINIYIIIKHNQNLLLSTKSITDNKSLQVT